MLIEFDSKEISKMKSAADIKKATIKKVKQQQQEELAQAAINDLKTLTDRFVEEKAKAHKLTKHLNNQQFVIQIIKVLETVSGYDAMLPAWRTANILISMLADRKNP